MNKNLFFILLSTLFISCLSESNPDKISNDLKQHFEHNDINTVIEFDEKEQVNSVEVTFYNFDLTALEYEEIKELAKNVSKRITTKQPEIKTQNRINVRFTGGVENNQKNKFINFIFE